MADRVIFYSQTLFLSDFQELRTEKKFFDALLNLQIVSFERIFGAILWEKSLFAHKRSEENLQKK